MPNNTFDLAILTISDAGFKGEREDASGDVISAMMTGDQFEEVAREILPDELEDISTQLREWCDSGLIDLILTTGGTGLGPRDVTPQATNAVIDLEVPGISESMRMQTLKNTSFSMLSRSVAGVRNGCLIINLPGSPKGVKECLQIVKPAVPHAMEMIKGWRTHPSN